MRGTSIMLLCLLVLSTIFAQTDLAVGAEAQPNEVVCLPKVAAENPLVLERLCMNRLNATCSCSGSAGQFSCNVEFNDKSKIVCKDGKCTLNFLGAVQTSRTSVMNADMLELVCRNIADAECTCIESDGAINCDITGAAVAVSCDDAQCTFSAGEYVKEFKFCEPSEKRININRTSGNVDVHIDGRVVREEDGMRVLEDGTVSISGKLRNGIGVDIVASLETIRIDSNVRAQQVEIREEVRSLFRKAIRLKYNSENFNTLDAIEVNLEQLKDGENIKSATIRFRVPKSMVNGTVVILRYGDDGSVDVLAPTVSEDGGYYIYEVDTNGLSLYAVATVNQISEPLAHGSGADESGAGAKACGAVAVILAAVLGLYVARAKM